jgi:hypothetical protein
MSKSAIDIQIENIASENEVSVQEAAHMFEQSSEYSLDLGNLPKQKHNWVNRGIKVSCEGAGHPHHSHFLIKR